MSFSTVLIANRGEIALRIIKGCHDLGLSAVAVYSDADRDAPYVRAADMAVYIGASEAEQSYLDGAKIIAAALRSGAGAVHPGYGFLAENATFAQNCADAGLVFVGPSANNIKLMGSKIAAKAAAVLAEVPVVPGYYGTDQSEDLLAIEAHKIGVPLLIKASAGGGGRGMRLVQNLADFPSELAAARAEAQAAFGDDQVLLERYVANARHIEVQILADAHANVRHLFERDCSLQRNHQKVIEESPAPNLAPDIRMKLLESAVRLAQGIGYDSAGTVEYLYDADTAAYYFLEMNTRLQVEHPVTEAVTGIDIVEWQLRAAMGEVLPFAQTDISCNGWAVEARLAAEDPANEYRPEIGKISHYFEPVGKGLRIDSGVYQGSEIGPYYDSMLAKVIGFGSDRASAIRTTKNGLERLILGGIGTNKGFLIDLLIAPDFIKGTHTTGTIPKIYPEGWKTAPIEPVQLAEAALVRHLGMSVNTGSSPWHTLGAWRVTENAGKPGSAIYNVEDGQVKISGRNGVYEIFQPDSSSYLMENVEFVDSLLSYEHEGLRLQITATFDGAHVTLHGRQGAVEFEILTQTEAMAQQQKRPEGGGNTITAPMPCLVSELHVVVGDTVQAGDAIVVIEAMKMLQTLVAPCTGTITDIPCQTGDVAATGTLLCMLNPEE